MAKGKGTKRLADGAPKVRGSLKRPAEPEPPSAEARAAVAESEAKQAQLADELRTVEKQVCGLGQCSVLQCQCMRLSRVCWLSLEQTRYYVQRLAGESLHASLVERVCTCWDFSRRRDPACVVWG